MTDFKFPALSTPLSVALLALLLVLPISKHLPGLLGKASAKKTNSIRKSRHETSEIVSLRVYPVKSCRGIRLPKTTLGSQGLELDRRWMFVDANTNEFLTIRQIPEMTLIETGLSDDGEFLFLSISGVKDRIVKIPSHPTEAWLKANTSLAQVKIWDTLTDGYLYGEDVNEMFSTFLDRDVRLAYKGPTPRVMQGNGDPRILGRTQTVNFPDVQPVLIASEASLAELNSRLINNGTDPITIERFRPNIIVKGTVPWSEDSWKLVRISRSSSDHKSSKPMDVDVIARCTRCQVPNVNPDTAQKHKTQPWDTLMAYRRIDEGMKYKPVFGMLGAPRDDGEIEVGMKFEVLEETDQHRYIKGF